MNQDSQGNVLNDDHFLFGLSSCQHASRCTRHYKACPCIIMKRWVGEIYLRPPSDHVTFTYNYCSVWIFKRDRGFKIRPINSHDLVVRHMILKLLSHPHDQCHGSHDRSCMIQARAHAVNTSWGTTPLSLLTSTCWYCSESTSYSGVAECSK